MSENKPCSGYNKAEDRCNSGLLFCTQSVAVCRAVAMRAEHHTPSQCACGKTCRSTWSVTTECRLAGQSNNPPLPSIHCRNMAATPPIRNAVMHFIVSTFLRGNSVPIPINMLELLQLLIKLENHQVGCPKSITHPNPFWNYKYPLYRLPLAGSCDKVPVQADKF